MAEIEVLRTDGTINDNAVNVYINGELISSYTPFVMPEDLNSSHPLRIGVPAHTSQYHNNSVQLLEI